MHLPPELFFSECPCDARAQVFKPASAQPPPPAHPALDAVTALDVAALDAAAALDVARRRRHHATAPPSPPHLACRRLSSPSGTIDEAAALASAAAPCMPSRMRVLEFR